MTIFYIYLCLLVILQRYTTRVLEECGSAATTLLSTDLYLNRATTLLSLLISTSTEPQNPDANSCWSKVPRASTKKLELIAPVFFELHTDIWKCSTLYLTPCLLAARVNNLTCFIFNVKET